MKTPHEQYIELLALTQLYLLKEYPSNVWIETERESAQFFKQFANSKKVSPNRPSQPRQELPVQAKKPLPTTPPIEIKPKIKEVVNTPAAPIKKEAPAKPTIEQKSDAFSHLETLPKAVTADFSDIRKILKEKFPAHAFIDTPLDDGEAKKVNTTWQSEAVIPDIALLSFNENPKYKAFLQNLAKAIQIQFGCAKVLDAQQFEQENRWGLLLKAPNLKLILASDQGLEAFPKLMEHFKENPKLAKQAFGKVPLHLLSNLSLYLQEPRLKSALWQALYDILKK